MIFKQLKIVLLKCNIVAYFQMALALLRKEKLTEMMSRQANYYIQCIKFEIVIRQSHSHSYIVFYSPFCASILTVYFL